MWQPNAAIRQKFYGEWAARHDPWFRQGIGRDPTEYERLVWVTNQFHFGHPYRWELFLWLFQMQWPDDLPIEVDGIRNRWVVRMVREFCRTKRVCLTGCASSFKTATSARYGYTLWKLLPESTSVYLSTTSGEAGESRGWGEMKSLWDRDKSLRIGKRLDSLQLITLDEEVRDEEGNKNRDFRDVIKCVKIKQGQEGRNAIGTICGRKNSNVLWIIDEAPFCDVGILEARVNLFSNHFAQTIMIGNAPKEGDPLYIDAEPYGDEFADGWRSVDKDTHERWPTRSGICLYFNGAKSPNMMVGEGKKPPFPRMMDREKRKEIRVAAMGEDTNIFWEQFFGFPPAVDVPDKVITFKLLESNGAFTKPEWLGSPRKMLAGMDVGFRRDGDPCVIDFGELGEIAQGRKVLCHSQDGIVLRAKQTSKEAFEPQIAGQVIDHMVQRQCHDLAIDISSDGGIMALEIEKQARERKWQLNLLPISSLGTADDFAVIPGDRRTGKEMFVNRVSQHWMSYRIAVGNGVIRGASERSKAVAELCGRKMFSDEKKRLGIEPKKEYKKRLKHSPDRADSRVYLSVLAYKHGLSGKVKSEIKVNVQTNEAQIAPQKYGGFSKKAAYSGR